MEGRSGAPEAAPERTKKLSIAQREGPGAAVLAVRATRRHWPASGKQAEIDHLRGSLTGVLGQMANFTGVADIIRDYRQKPIQPWDDRRAG
jgi:hypothetical protein